MLCNMGWGREPPCGASIVLTMACILASPGSPCLRPYQIGLPLTSLILLFHSAWTSFTTSSGMGM